MATKDVNHIAVTEDISEQMYDLLKEQFKGKVNIQKLQDTISSVKKIIQEQAVALAEIRFIDTAYGPILDEIGSTLGVARSNTDDESYRQALKIRAFRSRTHGTRSELITIISNATGLPPEEITIYSGLYKSIDILIVLTCLNYGASVDEITKMLPIGTNFRLINRAPSPMFGYGSLYKSDPTGIAGYGSVNTVTPEQPVGLLSSLMTRLKL